MVLVRFIVVFVWEAFALWSHLLQHLTHPLECIMEMKFLLCFIYYYYYYMPRYDRLLFSPPSAGVVFLMFLS